MTKWYLINTSVAALVSAFVFYANISPASACWGPNKEFGGLECGKGGGTDGASQSSQNSQTSQTSSNGPNTRPLPRPNRPDTSSQADNSKMQDDWNKGGGYGGGNDKQKDGDWGSGQRPPRQSSDNGDWGGSHRPPKTQSSDSGCRYGCGDDRPSRRPRDDYGSNDRGPVYHPNRDRGPYADDSYDRRPRYPRDDYGSYGRRDGGYYRPRIRVILAGPGYGGYGGRHHGGGDWNMSGGYGGR